MSEKFRYKKTIRNKVGIIIFLAAMLYFLFIENQIVYSLFCLTFLLFLVLDHWRSVIFIDKHGLKSYRTFKCKWNEIEDIRQIRPNELLLRKTKKRIEFPLYINIKNREEFLNVLNKYAPSDSPLRDYFSYIEKFEE